MLSKKEIRLIKQLHQKKYRQKEGLFVAEGIKVISEFLDSNFQLQHLYTTQSFSVSPNLQTLISIAELHKISALKTPNKAVALFKIPLPKPIDTTVLCVALDAVRDPGNLGTIIRLCDWFGVTQLLCSTTTVDCYNFKVVQASMGSLKRVTVSYLNLESFLQTVSVPVLGAFMKGENVYTSILPSAGILVLGNEANGISKRIEPICTRKISIPQFGAAKETESLNVATATAILLSEFKRRTI